MPRKKCQTCQRPEPACICRFFTSANNQISVVVLQHLSEVKQTKGTVGLLQGSLVNCQVLVGENFDQSSELQALLAHCGKRVLLLYPSEQARILTDDVVAQLTQQAPLTDYLLILIDATWKKAYRSFMLSTCLHSLPAISLPEGFTSQYQIRKTNKNNAFSSLEACCYALSLLEQNNARYQPLLSSFVAFNQFQQGFVPVKGQPKNE